MVATGSKLSRNGDFGDPLRESWHSQDRSERHSFGLIDVTFLRVDLDMALASTPCFRLVSVFQRGQTHVS